MQWVYTIGANTTCPLVLTDTGLLLVGDNDGVLHALGSYVPPPTPAPTPGGGGLSGGAKAGIAITVLLVVGVAGFFAYRKWGYLIRQGRKPVATSYANL